MAIHIVSPKSAALTRQVFGEPLTPMQVVERVCRDVQKRGREALFHYTEQFDRVRLTPESLRVSPEELQAAHAAADPALLDTIRRVRQNILAFQVGILHRSATLSVAGKHELRLRYRPMRRVGVTCPNTAITNASASMPRRRRAAAGPGTAAPWLSRRLAACAIRCTGTCT